MLFHSSYKFQQEIISVDSYQFMKIFPLNPQYMELYIALQCVLKVDIQICDPTNHQILLLTAFIQVYS